MLIRIELSDLKELITYSFSDDPELLSKYSHLDNPTLEECVDKNFRTIIEKGGEVNCYAIFSTEEGGNIGFTVTLTNPEIPHELVSFGIHKNFRTQKTVCKWLEEVTKLIGKYYYTALFTQNTRAIGFFQKNGFTKVEPQDDKSFVLLFRNYQALVKLKSKKVAHGS